MSINRKRLLFITEDFPSGLNGTSVKTRNTLRYLLEKDYRIDVCCFHFEGFQVHDLKHKNLRIFTVKSNRLKKTSLSFYIEVIQIIFSIIPITIKRLLNVDLKKQINKLLSKKNYDIIFYDGYSTLQYLSNKFEAEKIYIDDEDFTDLFWQRFILEIKYFKKIFYLHEYLKSLIYEFFYTRRVDRIWAISPRTKKRLERVSGVRTVLMPTIITLKENLYINSGSRIVFTGTLNWRENIEGLKWFISNHWPNILKFMPQTKLVVIGQGASSELISYLKSRKNIIYKGYVESLEDEYAKVCLSIAPVRINAGIKVKILTYMSYGLPVVSTEKASWGLASLDGILVSPDKSFAKYIIILLRNQKLRGLLSKKGYNNIKQNYSKKVLDNFLSRNLKNHE